MDLCTQCNAKCDYKYRYGDNWKKDIYQDICDICYNGRYTYERVCGNQRCFICHAEVDLDYEYWEYGEKTYCWVTTMGKNPICEQCKELDTKN